MAITLFGLAHVTTGPSAQAVLKAPWCWPRVPDAGLAVLFVPPLVVGEKLARLPIRRIFFASILSRSAFQFPPLAVFNIPDACG